MYVLNKTKCENHLVINFNLFPQNVIWSQNCISGIRQSPFEISSTETYENCSLGPKIHFEITTVVGYPYFEEFISKDTIPVVHFNKCERY